MTDRAAPPSGWLGRFVALFLGVPPLAVYAAELDEDDEPLPGGTDSHRQE